MRKITKFLSNYQIFLKIIFFLNETYADREMGNINAL